jgi:subtilase family serine protease
LPERLRRTICFALVLASVVVSAAGQARAAGAPTSTLCLKATGLACYSPQQIQRAYHLGRLYAHGLNGKGSTIVIVDPFGSPTIGSDLRAFDQAFHLPNPPAFRVLQPVGQVPPFDPSRPEELDKAGETTLDVEWSHAIAPGANILLVETPVPETTTGGGFRSMMAAEDYVIDHGLGDVISQSFSLPEQNFGGRSVIAALRKTYIRASRRGVTVLAATNDNGVSGPMPSGHLYARRVVQWPATDPLVTAVGGTELRLGAAGARTAPDVAWNDTWDPFLQPLDHQVPPPVPWSTSGGVSRIFTRPTYQDSVRKLVGDRRGVPDVSMSASLSGAVLTFSSFLGMPAWHQAGGTSEATPEFAGIVAIADQYARTRFGMPRLGLINPDLYSIAHSHVTGIVDVTRGNNTVSFHSGPGRIATVKGYSARIGYDLVTGVGTIDASRFVPELARVGHGIATKR